MKLAFLKLSPVVNLVSKSLVLISLLASASIQAESLCFDPLPQEEIDKHFRTKKPPAPTFWSKLLKLPPKKPADGVISIQTIDRGTGDKINLDYYALTFTPPPGTTLSSMFLTIRRGFPEIVNATGENDFKPYAVKRGDSISRRNAKLWRQQDLKNATMTFVLKQHRPALAMRATLGPTLVIKHGDVQVGCYSNTDFIFMTLNSKSGFRHPVAGNRGFALKDNGDGSWTFYSMGADRESGWGGAVLAKAKNLSSDGVFIEGHTFWLNFYPSLRRFLFFQGAKFNKDSFIFISNRYDYPLP